MRNRVGFVVSIGAILAASAGCAVPAGESPGNTSSESEGPGASPSLSVPTPKSLIESPSPTPEPEPVPEPEPEPKASNYWRFSGRIDLDVAADYPMNDDGSAVSGCDPIELVPNPVPTLAPDDVLKDGVWLVETSGVSSTGLAYHSRCPYHPDSYEYSEATRYVDNWPPISPTAAIHESEMSELVLRIVEDTYGASFIDPDTPVWFSGAEWEGISQPFSAVADQMWDWEDSPEENRKNRFLWIFVNSGEITEIVVFHGIKQTYGSVTEIWPGPGPTPSWYWDW